MISSVKTGGFINVHISKYGKWSHDIFFIIHESNEYVIMPEAKYRCIYVLKCFMMEDPKYVLLYAGINNKKIH